MPCAVPLLEAPRHEGPRTVLTSIRLGPHPRHRRLGPHVLHPRSELQPLTLGGGAVRGHKAAPLEREEAVGGVVLTPQAFLLCAALPVGRSVQHQAALAQAAAAPQGRQATAATQGGHAVAAQAVATAQGTQTVQTYGGQATTVGPAQAMVAVPWRRSAQQQAARAQTAGAKQRRQVVGKT